ncbi:chemotaxis protein CheB [Lysobacter sp. KIS68-7]|uniref:chemotaxis protein CheB n=1 Tax=Lysobacter sp. KIS68-7 TaxID=2904252 RepID=UPI0031BB47C9
MGGLEAIEEIEMPPVAASESIEVAEATMDSVSFEAPSLEAVSLEEVSLDALEAVSFEVDSEPTPTAAIAAEPVSEYGALSFTDDLNALDFESTDAPSLATPAPEFGQDVQDLDALLRDLGGNDVEAVEADDVAPMEMPAMREFAPKEALPSMDFDIAVDLTKPKETERAMPSFRSLSLEALTDEPHVGVVAATVRAEDAPVSTKFRHDLTELEKKISTLSLLPEMAHGARGAVVILAGIGGPDAVRQILTALPEGFPRAVLIHQRLDGGRYDRLVQQMARAASMPVLLAEAAQMIAPGKVYIVPPDIGVAPDAGAGLRFTAGVSLLDALPSDDSAVLLLSGADPALVDAAMAHAGRGALVAGQSPEGCYDAAAPIALAERGGTAGTPNELVQSLLQRWPA